MAELLAEVARFRAWAGDRPPDDLPPGEWECDYPHWGDLYEAVLGHLVSSPPESWSPEEWQAVLYTLARDNESEHLAEEIGLHHPATLVALAEEALARGEPDARWQLAEQLGQEHVEAERLLLILASDEAEYVRRRALGALARLGSPALERLALDAWQREDEHQEYARMVALDCLQQVGSPHLERLLAEAEQDDRPHLRNFAGRIRQGHRG